jgi:hypothetical protein
MHAVDFSNCSRERVCPVLTLCANFASSSSTVPQVPQVARAALISISNRNITYRKTLRAAVLECLDLASDPLIEFSAQAIKHWIGPDLAQLNDFEKLIQLLFHADRRIQNEALFTLRHTINNGKYHDSLVKGGIVAAIQSLSSDTTSEVIGFVAFTLRSLALPLARQGHIADILRFWSSDVPKIREGASSAIEVIANGFERDRKCLLDQDIIETVTGRHDETSPVSAKLAGTIITRLAMDYINAGRVHLIVTLVECVFTRIILFSPCLTDYLSHEQEPVRLAAIKSVTNVAGGADHERKALRDTLLPLLRNPSVALRDVASACLKQTLARDLITEGDFKQVFDLLENEEPCIRAPVITELGRHIHASNETARRTLVDAGILSATMHALTTVEDGHDLLSFIVQSVLPELGPSFTQRDGGASIIALLKHDEPDIRGAAAIAIRNSVESRHGSLQNLAGTRIISILHSTLDDDSVRDLWCYILPKTAPFLSNRDEIDILFDCLRWVTS